MFHILLSTSTQVLPEMAPKQGLLLNGYVVPQKSLMFSKIKRKNLSPEYNTSFWDWVKDFIPYSSRNPHNISHTSGTLLPLAGPSKLYSQVSQASRFHELKDVNNIRTKKETPTDLWFSFCVGVACPSSGG